MKKMIRALIIDDEKFAIETLQYEIERNCPEVEIVKVCQGGNEGLEAINRYQPDIVFLDIEMPYMNAFEMLAELDKIDFKIIFTTAYDQFAIKAIKVNALDYLLKPIGKEELINAVSKAKSTLETPVKESNIMNLLTQMLEDQNNIKKIGLPTIDGIEMIRVDHIICVKADSNYSTFTLLDGKRIIISKTLKYVEEKYFKDCKVFFRVHQSYLINLTHVDKYSRGAGGTIHMCNSKIIPVSRVKKEELITRLNIV